MVKLRYRPDGEPTGHLGLVGKGIMYDSGGISIKPSDPMHLLMKMDMGGAAAVLGGVHRAARPRGDERGHRLADVHRQHAVGLRLQARRRADGARRAHGRDQEHRRRGAPGDDGRARAGGRGGRRRDHRHRHPDRGGARGTGAVDRRAVRQRPRAARAASRKAAQTTDEPVWQLPLEQKYRKQLDSEVADITNLGGPFAGSTTAALFLNEFVGDTPWAHVDIAGTMQVDADEAWRSKGATGFGARLLAEVARDFRADV